MLKLAKYLKPYWWMVITAIVLLFIQANTDLALPDYMSRIVNKGIQQGGVGGSGRGRRRRIPRLPRRRRPLPVFAPRLCQRPRRALARRLERRS